MIEKSPLNAESAITAIAESMALPGKVCRLLGCTLAEFNALLKENADVFDAWVLVKEETRDEVEEKIISLAKQGNPKMIELYAKTQMMDRGYNGEKAEETQAPIVNLIMQKPEDSE